MKATEPEECLRQGGLRPRTSLDPDRYLPTPAETAADVPVQARIELTSVGWGTRIEMDCSYRPTAPGPDGGYGPKEYAMWVVDRNGVATPLSTWSAAPDGTVRIGAGTALALADIAEVEVRTASGDRVLLTAELEAT